jgi:hypothetical protein
VNELIQVSEEELADLPGMAAVRKRLLRSALAYYQEFIAQRRDDPDARAELIDTSKRVEKILADLAVLHAASKLYLLCQPAVLDELRLDERQRTKMKALTARVGKEWRDSLRDVGKLSPAQRRRQATARARVNEAAVNAILTAAQQTRLRQIGLQAEGVAAFREPEVVAALALSPRQRERIRTIEEGVLFAWLRPTAPGKPADEQALAVLSREQRRQWRVLTGAPVKGLVNPFAPAVGPRRPPKESDGGRSPCRGKRRLRSSSGSE